MLKTLSKGIAVFVLTASSLSFAGDKGNVDVIIQAKEGGNTWRISNIFSDSLKEVGYDTNVIPAGSCFNAQKHLKKNFNKKPTVFIYSELTHVNFEKRGCAYDLESGYAGPLYNRVNVMCTRKGEVADIRKFLASKDTFTVAASNTWPERIFTTLSDASGKKMQFVPYKSSGSATRGLLAGDTDFLYTGLVAKVAKDDKLDCFGVTSANSVAGIAPLNDTFPGYEMGTLSATWFAYTVNMTDEQKAEMANVAVNLSKESPTWGKWIKDSIMIPGSDIPTYSVDDVVKNTANYR